MTVSSDEVRQALAALRKARQAVFTTHVKPDGDGLGSIAALAEWFAAEGGAAEVLVPTAPAAKYAFLDPEGRVRVAGRDVDPAACDPDLVCIVDTGTWQQLEGLRPLVADSGATVLVIDHHRTQDPLADVRLVDPEAPACAMLVDRLFTEAGVSPTPRMARALFAALASDTAWFSLPTVDAETFRLAARLTEAGTDPGAVYAALYQDEPLGKVRLAGLAMAGMRPVLDGRAMLMRLGPETFRRAGVGQDQTENIISECLKVRGAEVGILLVETSGGEVRASLRSRPGVDILRVARRFGGGGHLRAAGMRLAGPADEAERQVLEAVRQALAEADTSRAEPSSPPARAPIDP